MFKKLLISASALSLSLSISAQTPTPLEVGFVYVSPIGDAGWTTQHDRGRKELEAKLGSQIKTRFVENVAEGADAERVIRDMAKNGAKLIFTTSFGYMNPTLKVAKEFPEVAFEHATGYQTAANMGNYNARFYEGRYLAGLVAGKMSKTGVAGYVAAFPIPEVLQGINAFTRGMRESNPKAQVKVVWTSSWFDPTKERDAAIALIGQEADVLTHHTDSTAVVQAAEEKGKFAVAYHSDMSKYGAKAQIAAVTHHWGDYYIRTTQAVLAKKWKAGSVWGGMKEGMIKVDVAKNVPKAVQELVSKRGAEIVKGSFSPFSGMIKDNEGKVRFGADGKNAAMSDANLNKMDYYVEGVVGKIQK